MLTNGHPRPPQGGDFVRDWKFLAAIGSFQVSNLIWDLGLDDGDGIHHPDVQHHKGVKIRLFCYFPMQGPVGAESTAEGQL